MPTSPSAPRSATAPPNDAQIFERGYRRYSGERLGPSSAIRAVAIQAFQRALGVRRAAWAKVLPLVIILFSFVPAIVFVGLVALTKSTGEMADQLPQYSDYYGQIVLAVLLFVAFLAPDMLCPDRRTGMLGLYLASPLTRDTYLLGKAIAIFTCICMVTAGPQLLMLLANSLQGSGVGALGDSLVMAVRILGAGVMVAVMFTALSLAISSLTDRKGFASAAIVLVLFAAAAAGGALADTGSEAFLLLDIGFHLPDALTARTFGVVSSEGTQQLSSVAVYGAAAFWTVLFAAVARVRYQILRVTR